MSTYLITGGAGYIGSNVGLHLVRGGHEIRILDNFSSSSKDKLLRQFHGFEHKIEVVAGDVRDINSCRDACKDIRYVLHHAAVASVKRSIESPEEVIAVNIGGTANMLIAAHESGKIERFVNASSCAVYGDGAGVSRHESSPMAPISPYGTSCVAAESLCDNYFRNQKLRTVSLRYFNVYGPGEDPFRQEASVVAKFAHAIERGESPVIFGDGNQSRDFVHVADAIDACLSACAAPPMACGHAFNVASGERTPIITLVEMISEITSTKVDPKFHAPRIGDIRNSRGEITKAAGLLMFTPSVRLEDGLRHLLQGAQQLLAA